MRYPMPLCAALALISLSALSLGACSTVPFGGGLATFTVAAGGLNWNAASGATAGYAQTRLSYAPFVAKDGKGNVQTLTVAGPCGRTDAVDTIGILQGNATANATTNGPTGAPSLQTSLAINEGLITGESARISELAVVQTANPKIDALHSYAACDHAVAANTAP